MSVPALDPSPRSSTQPWTVSEEKEHRRTSHLQTLLEDASPDLLELAVKEGAKILDRLKASFDGLEGKADAQGWIKQIRACTAVVTEISYNDQAIPYRAEIEFIQWADWEKELRILFQELQDSNGRISKDCTSKGTDAGVAYAKIKAVYPERNKDDIANSVIEDLLGELAHILGTTRKIDESDHLRFYNRIQSFINSQERLRGEKEKDRTKHHTERGLWPLIKVVRLYVKSPALATGAVIVDLPGMHDSNAARATVADRYMEQLTGRWIVTPINRAVDDKVAKHLLGDSFKRQLKLDGGFRSVTFICSKTDDISITEAQESLGLEKDLEPLWEELNKLVKKQETLMNDLDRIKESKLIHTETMKNTKEDLDRWKALREDLENGNEVSAPYSNTPKKRKGSKEQYSARKKPYPSIALQVDDDSILVGSDSEDDPKDFQDGSQGRKPLTAEKITTKIAELREKKKEAKTSMAALEEGIRHTRAKQAQAISARDEIKWKINMACIFGRNQYSKDAIRQDYAAGIKELDQENEAIFKPEEEARDYEEVARSLPVFCVSSRGYQNLKRRLQKDGVVPGFKNIDETGIPMLQKLLNSLALWVSTNPNDVAKKKEQKVKERQDLKDSIEKLESNLQSTVEGIVEQLRQELSLSISDKYEVAVDNATAQALETVQKWASRSDKKAQLNAGGYAYNTYKAICLRDGIFQNYQGLNDWNQALAEPMMKVILPGWDKQVASTAI
ncbi:MAG: hypothetical protein Q9171_001518 [Xanthocarpia ochracea]